MGVRSKLKELKDMAETITDVWTRDVTATQTMKMYKYEDFVSYAKKRKIEIPQIAKCTIAVEKRGEFDNMRFSSAKYVIRIVMLDEKKNPIYFEGHEDEYVGTVAIADAIDKKLEEFMGEKTVKIVSIGGK